MDKKEVVVKKRTFIIVVLFLLLVIFYLFNLLLNQKEESNLNTQDLISYESFQKIFEEDILNTTDSNISLKNSTKDANMVFIDKEFSFDKRAYITTTGEQNWEPTSEMAIYSDLKSENEVYVRFIYTNSYIGNDILDWSDGEGFKNINLDFVKSSQLVAFSYKNIIVIVNQISKEEINKDFTRNVLGNWIKVLKKY
ncbi:hypothetical protein WG909_12890 [Peptostreptococcaceae bacterium AGR-M142]